MPAADASCSCAAVVGQLVVAAVERLAAGLAATAAHFEAGSEAVRDLLVVEAVGSAVALEIRGAVAAVVGVGLEV